MVLGLMSQRAWGFVSPPNIYVGIYIFIYPLFSWVMWNITGHRNQLVKHITISRPVFYVGIYIYIYMYIYIYIHIYIYVYVSPFYIVTGDVFLIGRDIKPFQALKLGIWSDFLSTRYMLSVSPTIIYHWLLRLLSYGGFHSHGGTPKWMV